MASKTQGTQTVPRTGNKSKPNSAKLSRNNIVEQLSSLAGSKETIHYFRTKILQYEKEQELFKKKLEKYMKVSEDRRLVEAELLKRRDKISALQKALSQLQNSIFREKERSNKLQGEVDLLKIKEEECHLKIQQLLQMTKDKKLHDDIVYIFKEPLNIHVCHRMLSTNIKDREVTEAKYVDNKEPAQALAEEVKLDALETLKKQNDAIHAMIEKQAELTQQRVEAMVKDCSITLQEAELLNKQDREQIQSLIQKLKEAEENLRLVNAEFLDTRANLRREEILREMQKSVLLAKIESAVHNVSVHDTVQDVITKVSEIINTASELFESVENIDLSAFLVQELDGQNVAEPSKNTVHVDIHPPQVRSSVRSKSLEDLTDSKNNEPFKNVNSRLQHTQSTGQFIHFRSDGDHGRHTQRHVAFHPGCKGQNLPKRTVFAPLRLNKLLRPYDHITTANLTSPRVNFGISQPGIIRPKSADPRHRKPPIKGGIRSSSAMKPSVSHQMGPAGDAPSGSTLKTDWTSKEKVGGFVRLSKRTPPSNTQSHESSRRVRSASKGSHTTLVAEKNIQCDLNGDLPYFDHPRLFVNNDVHCISVPSVDSDETKVKGLFASTSSGLFAPKVHQSASPPHLHRAAVDSNHPNGSSISAGSNSGAMFEKQSRPKVVGAADLLSHKYCDERIDNLKQTIKSLNAELQEQIGQVCHGQCMIQEYEKYCASLEQDLKFQKTQLDNLKAEYNETNNALTEQLKAAKARLNKLERYRRLEIEGFQTDIKMLTQKIKELEKHLFKTVLLFEQGERDMEYLETIHATTKKTVQTSNEVKRIKAKLYQLENDLRNI